MRDASHPVTQHLRQTHPIGPGWSMSASSKLAVWPESSPPSALSLLIALRSAPAQKLPPAPLRMATWN